MTFPVTALYAALFAVFLVVLSNLVSAQRGRVKAAILHADDMQLALWIRRHGNFVENVPMALILMGLCEARGLPALWLHVGGIALIAARVSHVFGLAVDRPITPLRMVGAGITQLLMLAAAAYLIVTLF